VTSANNNGNAINGPWGRILTVDLGTGKVGELQLDPDLVRKYFLGSGLAARMLMDSLDESIDPLDPRSPLIFMSGLFTGSILPGTSKLSVCARSPLTGIWNEATVGGHWPAELRRTPLAGILLWGKAASPVCLVITSARGHGEAGSTAARGHGEAGSTAAGGHGEAAPVVEIRDARHIWGKDTYEVEAILRPEIGRTAKIATIGPAGERGMPLASIIFDPPNTRVAARAGIGAVMGSKNLKAIVVTGDPALKVPIARPEELRQVIREESEALRKNTAGLHDFGTSGGVATVESFGDLPIKNWQLGAWKQGAQAITGQTIQPKWLDHHYACYACPIRCGKIYRVAEKGLYGHGPEYETLGMLGSNCLNDDPVAIIEGNEWLNRYGIDTISGGAVIGFALEAFERGLISKRDTGGVDLKWDGASMLALVHMLGRGEHIGELLGRGVKRAADEIGGMAVEFAVHTKGLEYPAHDPRGHVSMALNYATGARGACHLEALTYFIDRGITIPDLGYSGATNPHTSVDKPPMVKKMQDYLGVFNPLGMCKFLFVGRIGPSKVARWLTLFTGWDFDQDEVMKIGERLFNLKRMYNVRLGISRKDDVLPPRLLSGGKPDGFAKGVLPDLGNMLHAYYELRDWTPEGIPTDRKLADLGL